MASQTRGKGGKSNVQKETDSKSTKELEQPKKKPAAKKPAARKAKSYTVNKQVPGVFETEDGKTVVFHEVGAEVAAGDPCVDRALELWPDNFTPA